MEAQGDNSFEDKLSSLRGVLGDTMVDSLRELKRTASSLNPSGNMNIEDFIKEHNIDRVELTKRVNTGLEPLRKAAERASKNR